MRVNIRSIEMRYYEVDEQTYVKLVMTDVMGVETLLADTAVDATRILVTLDGPSRSPSAKDN